MGGFYYPMKTLGCFAYALDSFIYDEILDSNKEKLSLDNLISVLQIRHYKRFWFSIWIYA